MQVYKDLDEMKRLIENPEAIAVLYTLRLRMLFCSHLEPQAICLLYSSI